MLFWMPKMDLTFHQVQATRWGRVKMWCHYNVLHPVILPLLPRGWWMPVFKASRRWLYGPNANNEDLHAAIRQLMELVRAEGV
jgi:hypothetical protein